MGNKTKPTDNGNVQEKMGSSQRFWVDQIPEGMKQYPKVATPNIPKLGQQIWNPRNPYFAGFNAFPAVVPPIMSIKYIPVIGTPAGDTDPSNLDGTFSNIISTMRQKCTTAYNYDQGSLAAAILGAGTIPMLLAHIKRRLCSYYMNTLGSNLSTDDIWAAFSDGDWAQHPSKADAFVDLDKTIGLYNDIVDVYNSIAPPDFFPVFRRWEEMESVVFRDLDDDPHGCAQYYFFRAAGYYFPEQSVDPENPGYVLKWKTYYGDVHTELQRIYDLAKTLQNNQDMVQIFGDICKTYGDERYQVEKISDDYHEIKQGFSTVYDPTINFSVYHATILPVEPRDVLVRAATGRLEGRIDFMDDIKAVDYRYDAYKKFLALPKLYNAQKYDESNEFIAETTQWMISDTEYLSRGYSITNVGTEVLCEVDVWYYTIENGVRVLNFLSHRSNVSLGMSNNVGDGDQVIADCYTWGDIKWNSLMSSFAYSPMCQKWAARVSGGSAQYLDLVDINAELEYPCFITPETLEAWHDATRYRMWGLPHLVQLEADGKARARWN